ncbi:3227_t:CDS:2 [Diversispora eburnea]|uniref:3227_t:CDS:1 n=1 Tax=Diversispora eburnea TaxID=1213867 RepID=A0A9N8ZYC0_9GLOM|nr:3227_t:CDS:2 [Diversispora eburnea]
MIDNSSIQEVRSVIDSQESIFQALLKEERRVPDKIITKVCWVDNEDLLV